eukprot:c35459_g1_i1 orf=199-402(-)
MEIHHRESSHLFRDTYQILDLPCFFLKGRPDERDALSNRSCLSDATMNLEFWEYNGNSSQETIHIPT